MTMMVFENLLSLVRDDWTRAKLPTALGGLGLRSAETLRDIAMGCFDHGFDCRPGALGADV